MTTARLPAAVRGMTLLLALTFLGGERCVAEPPASGAELQRVVIPFDFQSKFDDGRYGKLVGDMIWKKLEREGGFVIPESMLDVRDWAERTKKTLSPATPLDELQRIVCDEFGAQVAIWGSVERVPGNAVDVYDFEIRVADFSPEKPRLIFEKKGRTQTVSEIPHVYVKEALDKLYSRSPPAPSAPDLTLDERWRTGKNLVQGDFERGEPAPAGWDRPSANVKLARAPNDLNANNRAIRFTFGEDVAGTTGVLYYSDFFPVEAGALYRFQVRWRSTGSAVKVFIKCYDEFSQLYKGEKSPSSSQKREVYRSQQNLQGTARQWNVHTEDFTPKHTQFTPRWGRVMLYAYWPAGSVEFDDVIVKQIRPGPANPDPSPRRPSLETKVTSEELEAAGGKTK